MKNEFWKDKRVLITGHTGFKGSWLSLLLQQLGSEVVGYALPPPTNPSLFVVAQVAQQMVSLEGDVRNFENFKSVLEKHRPEIIFHLAAQPLVRRSYRDPIETYSTNIMGTVNMFEAVRQTEHTRVIVNITSDKCYENQDWVWGCRENDLLGGVDPYSSSKACSELITSAFRRSFFSKDQSLEHSVSVATARAGNVIGGGDWSENRLIPDCVRAWMKAEALVIRYPNAIRPWQHVLEPLCGYLQLAEALYHQGSSYEGAWNFGPSNHDICTAQHLVEKLSSLWGTPSRWQIDDAFNPEETDYLKLDCTKAKIKLGWSLKWDLETALTYTVSWFKAYQQDAHHIRNKTLEQIEAYLNISYLSQEI